MFHSEDAHKHTQTHTHRVRLSQVTTGIHLMASPEVLSAEIDVKYSEVYGA